MDIKRFGEYLKLLRQEKSLSTHKLAELTGVSQSYISHVESGRKKNVPSPEILKKLSKALNVDYFNLMAVAGYIDEDDLLDPVEVIINEQEEKTEKQLNPQNQNNMSIEFSYLKNAELLLKEKKSEQTLKMTVMMICTALELKVNGALFEVMNTDGTLTDIEFDYLNSLSLKAKLSKLEQYTGLNIEREKYYKDLLNLIDVRDRVAHSVDYKLTFKETKAFFTAVSTALQLIDVRLKEKQ